MLETSCYVKFVAHSTVKNRIIPWFKTLPVLFLGQKKEVQMGLFTTEICKISFILSSSVVSGEAKLARWFIFFSHSTAPDLSVFYQEILTILNQKPRIAQKQFSWYITKYNFSKYWLRNYRDNFYLHTATHVSIGTTWA